MSKVHKLFIIVLAIVFSSTYIGVPAWAGTLEFEGVPVDITTADNEDLVIVPGTGGNVQVGDAIGTDTNATTNDDLYVTGVLEADGAIYADSGMVAGASIIPSVDLTHNLGSSTKYWKLLYTSDIFTGDITKIKGVTYSWPSAQGGVNTVLTNDGSGNLAWGVGGGGGGGSLPTVDTQTLVYGSGDATKLLRFEVDGLSPSVTRVLSVQDLDGTVYVTGGQDVSVLDGGTGASDALTARLNLGLVIGTNIQAWDADLDTWATKTAPAGVVVGTTDAQLLTNKALADATTYIVDQADNSKVMQFETSGVAAGMTRTLTVPDASGTLAVSASAPLSLNAATGDLSLGTVPLGKGGTGAVLADPGADRLLGWDDTDNATKFITLGSGLSYDAATDTLSSSGTALPVVDGTAIVKGSVDDTKLLKFEVDGFAVGGTTHTLTVPDANGTLAVSASAPLALNATTGDLSLGTVPINKGGTGTTTAPVDGKLLIGKTDGSYAVNTLTAGANITITPGDGSITIAGNASSAPTNATYITQVAEAGLSGEQALAALTTGLLKNTTGTGVLSVAAAGTDYLAPSAIGTTVQAYDADLDDWALLTAPTSTVAGISDAQTFTNKSFEDATTSFLDDLDNTKVMKLQLAGIGAGLTRTLTVPDANGTLAVSASAPLALNATTGDLSLGTVPINKGGTGTTTAPVDGKLLIGKTDGSYAVNTLTAGANITITPGDGSITIAGNASSAPTNATYITQVAEAGLSGEQALAALTTGLLKNTTGTGVLSVAAAGTDYYAPGGTDVSLADGGTGASLVDPDANNLMAWDDTDASIKFLTIGSGLVYTHATHTLSATGSGDVTGPGSSTDNALARFDLTTGKLLQNSGVIVDDTNNITGVATLNKITFTQPATAATLTIVDGKTLTASKTMTLTSAGDLAVLTFPNATATIPSTSDKLSVFTATTSAELAGVLTDEIGSAGGGVVVYSKSPSLESPLIKGEAVVALTPGALISTNASLGNIFTISYNADAALSIPTNPTNGQKCIWRFKNTDSSSHTLTLTTAGAGSFRFGSTIAGMSATPPGKMDYIGAVYNLTDDKWDVIAYAKGYV